MRQLRLESGQRLAEEAERLEEAHHIRADPAGRTEVDDLDREAPADAVEPADALLDERWIPGQVEQHEAAAELEVAALAAAFGGDEQAGPLGLAELGDLGVAARRRELLVEHAGRQLRAVAERRAQHLQRLAVRHEHERLLSRVPPAPRLRQQPVEARVAGVHRLRLAAQRGFVGGEHGSERGARGERAADAIDLLPPRDRMRRRRAAQRRLDRVPQLPARRLVERDRNAHARRQAADVGAAGRARAGRQRRGEREPRLEAHVLGKLVRTQQLQQPEEPVGVVLERRRAQEQHVAAERRDRRDRAPAGLAGMAGRPAQPLRFVHDEEVDARRHRLVGQLRALGQHLQRDHGAAMDVERVEVGAEVARDVGEARRVEQREHLVVLPPQLAQPLHGQRLGRDDEAAFHLPGVHEPVQDERGLDRLAEADLVGEQPAHRVAGARALGDVELVREEPDASAQERAQPVRFAQRQQVQDVQARHEVLDLVEIAEGEPFEERALELQRPQLVGDAVRPFASRTVPSGSRAATSFPHAWR